MGKLGATEILVIAIVFIAIPFLAGYFIGKGVGFKQGIKFEKENK